MRRKYSFVLMIFMLLVAGAGVISGQESVPAGIHYQAVARDNAGQELINTDIEVQFSIRAGSPVGTIVYQEVFTDVRTSRYGVFSLIIGKGTRVSGTAASFGEIDWSTANHYLQVEVKFDNLFMDMGTMQFMAVPYAMYAGKSLEPGPAGPIGPKGDKGDAGDPASDDQTLSVVNIDGSDYLAISGGNQVKVSTIEKDGDPTNELQDLRLTGNILTITQFTPATQINLAPYLQTLSYNTITNLLGTSGQAATVDLSELQQDLSLSGNTLSLSGDGTTVNLSGYMDNTDGQTLTYTESTNTLAISGGNSLTLGTPVAFRARNTSTDIAPIATNVNMTYDAVDYNIGSGLNSATGVFTAPVDGIYTFNVAYYADGGGDGRELAIYVNTVLYEKIAISIAASSTITVRSVTMRLSASNAVSFVVYTGLSIQTGTGSFSGYKVN